MAASVMVVDDDLSHLKIIQKVFKKEGYEVLSATNGQSALDQLRVRPVDLVVTDLMMPGINGSDLLKAVRALRPRTEVILMTAFGSIERAVEALKCGASDFIEKPIKRAALLRSARKALEHKELLTQNKALRAELNKVEAGRKIIGNSEPMRRVLELVNQVAPTRATILIQGASGTGKELIARALHRLSPRVNRSFVAINCAALPESLLESELFGHERGAFTSAHQRKLGRFEMADKGTLFLDEIGEMELATQAKLLRALQEGEIERVGGTSPIKVDVRIIAATNKNLLEEVHAKRFREDLFYRLNVIVVDLPPLKARPDDVTLLSQHFLAFFNNAHQRNITHFTQAALDLLCAHDWPGNVRELRNVLERAVILCKDNIIDVIDLPLSLRQQKNKQLRTLSIPLGTTLDVIKRDVILGTLAMVNGDKRLAAQLLGIATRTIYRLLEDQSPSEPTSGSS